MVADNVSLTDVLGLALGVHVCDMVGVGAGVGLGVACVRWRTRGRPTFPFRGTQKKYYSAKQQALKRRHFSIESLQATAQRPSNRHRLTIGCRRLAVNGRRLGPHRQRVAVNHRGSP